MDSQRDGPRSVPSYQGYVMDIKDKKALAASKMVLCVCFVSKPYRFMYVFVNLQSAKFARWVSSDTGTEELRKCYLFSYWLTIYSVDSCISRNVISSIAF